MTRADPAQNGSYPSTVISPLIASRFERAPDRFTHQLRRCALYRDQVDGGIIELRIRGHQRRRVGMERPAVQIPHRP